MTRGGFAVPLIAFVVIAAIIAGGLAYHIFHQNVGPNAYPPHSDTNLPGVQNASTQSSTPVSTTGSMSSTVSLQQGMDFVRYRSDILGVSFLYPKFLGPIKEATSVDINGAQEDYLSLDKPTTSNVNMLFWPVNSTIVANGANSGADIFLYDGGPLDPTCSELANNTPSFPPPKNSYFKNEDYFIQLTSCDLRTLPSGLRVAEFSGTYSALSGVHDISTIEFEGAFLQTKSATWPGLVVFTDSDDDYLSYARDAELLKAVINSFGFN